jgi:Flp pilus assembly protein TadG
MNHRHFLPAPLRRLVTAEAGITGVQFAMALPVILGMVFGVVEMGRLMMAQNTLVHAANEAARFAMVRSGEADTVATEADIITLAKQRMTGLDPERATVSVVWTPANQPGGRVTVAVDYPYSFSSLGLKPINLNGAASTIIAH